MKVRGKRSVTQIIMKDLMEVESPVRGIKNSLKKGVVEKSGEELGKVANKGVGVVKVMGVDRGIRNMAVLSNNIFFNSAQLKDVKGFGKGLVKGFKNKDEKSEEEKKE